MGISAAGALFGNVQQRVLALLFAQPDRAYRTTELVALARSGSGAVQRELQKLEAAGLIHTHRLGNQKYWRANRESPVFSELHSLILKTVGLAEPLSRALAPLAKRIRVAAVFGSVAKGTESPQSDVDLLVLSDDLSYSEVYEALLPVERLLGRTINPTVMSPASWKEHAQEDSFASRVARGPLIPVIGDHRVLVTT